MTARGWVRAAVLATALALVACGSQAGASFGPGTGAFAATAPIPDGDWTQFDFGSSRTGVGPAATGITARDVRLLRARVISLDGTVDGSAIQLHGVRVRGRSRDVAFVTTTYGRTVAFDPGRGQKLWEFTPAATRSLEGSPQITTATPIADPDRRFVYAASPNGLIHKLRVADGREVRAGHWPARVTFDPTKEKIASSLNISGSSLLVAIDGYDGDGPVYQGHLAAIDRSSGRITHVWNALCSDLHGLIDPPSRCGQSDAAIWGRAGAVIEPGSGRVLVSTGNGDFNGRTDWGDSVLELGSTLRLLHNWTPTDQQQLNASDTDLGSTSPAPLGSFGGYRLAAQGGKSGRIALLDLSRLDGTRGPAGPRTGGELGYVPTPGSAQMFTAPVIWHPRSGTLMFVADGGGTAAYRLVDRAHPRLAVVWQNSIAGTSPVLAGGLLYVYDPGGSLYVYSPADGRQLAALPVAPGHWNSPIVVGGRIIEPVGNGNDHATSGAIFVLHLPGR